MAAPLTETAIRRMRDMIASGRLQPGQRLPPEAELAAELGASRNTAREAVRALVTARVLDVRRGDGTYVTSLRPELLLDGIGAAAELMQDGFALELVQVRRILEPAATRLAAGRIDVATLESLATCLRRMEESRTDDELVRYDEEFHATVAAAADNETLASMLVGVSSRTSRTRVWRGIIEADAKVRTISQHADILNALRDGDATLAEAAATVHVATTEEWLRRFLADRSTEGRESGALEKPRRRPRRGLADAEGHPHPAGI